MKALIIGGSKGIGKSISQKLKELKFKIISPSSKELDTSKISTVKKFIKQNNNFVSQILVSLGIHRLRISSTNIIFFKINRSI